MPTSVVPVARFVLSSASDVGRGVLLAAADQQELSGGEETADLCGLLEVGKEPRRLVVRDPPGLFSLAEHAIDGEHLLIAREIPDWAEKIRQLMGDESLRERIAENGRKLCLEHYTVEGQWPAVLRALTVF